MKEHSREICYPGTHLAVEDGDVDDHFGGVVLGVEV